MSVVISVASGASFLGVGEHRDFGAIAVVEDDPPEVLVRGGIFREREPRGAGVVGDLERHVGRGER